MKPKTMLLAVLSTAFMLAGLSGCVKEEFDRNKPQKDVVTIPADVDDWKEGEPVEQQTIF